MTTHGLARQIQRIKTTLRHAFALQPEEQTLAAEEQALLEKIATAIVARQMTGPAVLFLESVGPMNFLGSQALHFLTPILDLVCDSREIERAARLLERREAIPRLIALIETVAAADGTPAR